MTQAWLCPHGARRQLGHYRMGAVAQERRVGLLWAAHPWESVWTRKTQLVLEGRAGAPCPLPSSLLWGPRGFGPVRMVAAPNANQERPCLRSSFYSAPPALSLRLGPSQRLLRSLQIPAFSLLFAAVRRPGRWGPKSPSSWLPGLGGLPEGDPRDRSRRRLGPAGRALGALESVLVRGGETCVLDQHCLCWALGPGPQGRTLSLASVILSVK